MLSIIVLVRNTQNLARICLQSVRDTVVSLGLGRGALEIILIDDCSDPAAEIPQLFQNYRNGAVVDVRILRFTRPMHYTYGVAMGLSVARGAQVLFLSHDMALAPACLTTLLNVAAS